MSTGRLVKTGVAKASGPDAGSDRACVQSPLTLRPP